MNKKNAPSFEGAKAEVINPKGGGELLKSDPNLVISVFRHVFVAGYIFVARNTFGRVFVMSGHDCRSDVDHEITDFDGHRDSHFRNPRSASHIFISGEYPFVVREHFTIAHADFACFITSTVRAPAITFTSAFSRIVSVRTGAIVIAANSGISVRRGTVRTGGVHAERTDSFRIAIESGAFAGSVVSVLIGPTRAVAISG